MRKTLIFTRALGILLVLGSLVSLLRTFQFFLHHDVKPSLGPKEILKQQLTFAFPYDLAQELPKHIWQTWKHSPPFEKAELGLHFSWQSWSNVNPDYSHELVTDSEAQQLIQLLFAQIPEIIQAYTALPQPVLQADFFRYLILLAVGGVYSDIDTSALKPIEVWVPPQLRPFGMVIGIEADPDRPDWNEWYARRIQFCQWTIVAKPGHPILVEIVALITMETLRRERENELMEEIDAIIMDFTGPGIWTDTLFNHFNNIESFDDSTLEPHNVTWRDFSNLKVRKLIGDVVVLPITSFSPGLGHMGSGLLSDDMAFAHHSFSGSWKPGN